MADQLEPEVVGDLLNEHFTEMSKIVLSQNGMIDKYIGDGMMVLFGVPAADADDPRRAVWSAVKMQRKFLEIRNRWTKRIPETTAIDLGIGIHCGDVVFGNFGSRKKTSYTAIGDTVNIASRLEGIAKRHQVIISKSVASHLPDTFRLEELGPRQIRGKTSQLELYNVILE